MRLSRLRCYARRQVLSNPDGAIHSRIMKDPILRVFLLVLLLAVAGTFYYRYRLTEEAPPPLVQGPEAPAAGPRAAVPEAAAPPIRHPVPTLPTPTPDAPPTGPDSPPISARQDALPPLDASDARVQSEMARLFAGQRLEERFNLDAVVRRFVVTVDNLPGPKLPRRRLTTRSAPGRFAVSGEHEALYLSSDNYARYTPFVQLLEAVDSERLASAYVRLYPLFQQAYEELGYPSGYFNDRLIDVIDHLLETPDIEGPVQLVQPRVMYEFADPQLEALSAGQKVLIRIGPDNAARTKAKLRELRRLLTDLPQPLRHAMATAD
jgi:hypothetical protein